MNISAGDCKRNKEKKYYMKKTRDADSSTCDWTIGCVGERVSRLSLYCQSVGQCARRTPGHTDDDVVILWPNVSTET